MSQKDKVVPPQPGLGWLWKMAWRDSRRSRGRLLLFIASIIVGIAALVAINSFGENLKKDIDAQAGELLGADLILETRVLPDEPRNRFLDSLEVPVPTKPASPRWLFSLTPVIVGW